MADDVTLPGTGAKVATEELTGNRHAQVMLPQVQQVNLVAVLAPATAGGYLLGEQIGELVLIQDVPTGIYELATATLIDVTSTLNVPDFQIYGYGIDAGATPPAYPGDGDPLAPDTGGGGLGTLFTVPAGYLTFADLAGIGYFHNARPPAGLNTGYVLRGTTATDALFDLYLGVVAAEATGAQDFTNGLVLSVVLHRIGSAADETIILGM